MLSHRQCWQFKKKMLSLQHPSAHLRLCVVLHLWIAQHSHLSLPSLQTNLFSRWTDQRDRPTVTPATKSPGGRGKAEALPREAICWWWPLWSVPEKAQSSQPQRGQCQDLRCSFPKVPSSLGCLLPREWEPLPHTGYHLHPPCANMRNKQTNYQLEERRRRQQGAFSAMCDSPVTTAWCSLWLQPGKEHPIPALFLSCNQDSCKAAKIVTPALKTFMVWTIYISVRLPLAWDTVLATIGGTHELHG